MFARSLILPGLVLALLLGASAAMAQESSPAALSAATATDRVAGDMVRLQRQRVQKLSEKRLLVRTYETQLRELDRLKRSRASWRRDRQIRSSKAESQTTAERLSRADAELLAIDGFLRRQRQSLLAAMDRELALRPGPARRALLDRLRAQVSAQLAPAVRKILVPDDSLDELADPAELAEQIALIQQAEAELRREREALRQREDRYTRMARLRDQRDRANQMGEMEDEVVRRAGRTERTTTGPLSGGQDSPGSDPVPPEGYNPTNDGDPGGLPSGGGGGPESGGGTGGSVGEDSGFEQSSILLTDVVDSGTIDALRRAGRSSSPRMRADAASRARRQVESRLQQLERNRQIIQRHLGMLRQGQ